MKYLELNFAEPERNLACDEALLELFETERIDDGLLRLWQPQNYFVVLGHSNRLRAEADSEACRAAGIPILRRMSGGGAVVQGPGCLNYSLFLDNETHDIRNIQATFHYVLNRHRRFLGEMLCDDVRIEGVSDLTLGGRKFSGNAQYRKSHYVLVHGTLLVDFDLLMIDRFLRLPEKQPQYRANRPHLEFVTNLGLDPNRIRDGLRELWRATATFDATLPEQVDRLVSLRYGRKDWSSKF